MNLKMSSQHVLLIAILFVTLVPLAQGLINVHLSKATSMRGGFYGQPVTSYYANVSVGTPVQFFKMLIDTDATETWVPKHSNLGIIFSRLNYRNGYSNSVSQTANKQLDNKHGDFTFEYQGVLLTGSIIEDYFTFVNRSKILQDDVVRQKLLVIHSASNDRLSELLHDGVIAMCPTETHSNGLGTVLDSFVKKGKLEEPKFSLYLDNKRDSDDGGQLILGGVDQRLFEGEIKYNPVFNSTDRWQVKLEEVRVGETRIAQNVSSYTAVISTGVNDIFAPAPIVPHIAKILGVGNPAHDGLRSIDCLKVVDLPTVHFKIGGQTYSVPPASYIKSRVEGTIFKSVTCYLSFLPNESHDSWILGTNFLSNFYTVYDVAKLQVGFATKKKL